MDMKPIAMRCSLEQFEDIKPILIQHGLRLDCCDNFKDHPYLTNNYFDNLNYVINNYSCFFKNDYNRTVFEEWNKDTFLEYCNIKPLKLLRR